MAILESVWAYGVQLWGTAFKYRNTLMISKQIIVNAPWYVTNDTLHHDLDVPYVRDEIKRLGYTDRMEELSNILATNLMKKVKTTRRLKRKLPQDLYT